MTVTRDERSAMCDLFEVLGPDEPTLCGEWTTRDLLAHLLLRERRLDASLGILVPALAGRAKRIQSEIAERPFPDMVRTFRGGPPIWTPWALPVIGDRVNLFEFFVHHEDVRRAQPDWEPRPEDQTREDALWGSLKLLGRPLFRHSPVGVVLRAAGRDDIVARRGPTPVHLVGQPSEITLVGFGRSPDVARLVVQGDPEHVEQFVSSPRGI